ncbi:MAG: FAD-dependent oxidoreductase [Candidatus Orphnella occulta]|nr:FAD-dependent oxidoreductase [Candidatus Orphnella occulta]
MIYDLIVIGAGPAGITASIYAARKKMNIFVLSKDIGGQTAWSGDIENYTGYQFITGPELTKRLKDHIDAYKIKVNEGEEILSLIKDKDIISIKTDKAQYEAKAVIIASGKMPKELGIKGEQEFKTKGIAYCATCDGPLFANKEVAVIGGGNSALDAAIGLEKIASKIYIINIGKAFTADAIMQEAVKKSTKITVLNESRIVEVRGEKFVKAIEIERNNTKEEIAVEGVFVEIGLVPNSDFVKGVDKNNLNEIIVNCVCETSIPGIFAAGDVTNVPEKQIIVAAGEGAKAALSAFRYLINK